MRMHNRFAVLVASAGLLAATSIASAGVTGDIDDLPFEVPEGWTAIDFDNADEKVDALAAEADAAGLDGESLRVVRTIATEAGGVILVPPLEQAQGEGPAPRITLYPATATRQWERREMGVHHSFSQVGRLCDGYTNQANQGTFGTGAEVTECGTQPVAGLTAVHLRIERDSVNDEHYRLRTDGGPVAMTMTASDADEQALSAHFKGFVSAFAESD